LGVPVVVPVAPAVFGRFVVSSLDDDFGVVFLEGGSSLLLAVVVAAFLLFLVALPESTFLSLEPIGVAGRLFAFEVVEEAPLASAFSALRVAGFDVVAAEAAAVRCLILADDDDWLVVVSVEDSVAAVAAALFVGLEGCCCWGAAAFMDFPACCCCCCSGIDGSFAADNTDCDIKGGGNGAGGFMRETLPQLVENHLESTGTRRLLVICVPPLPEADAVPISFISTKASQPL
jgi:hypothetical protein